MKAFLLDPDRDFELTIESPPAFEALVEDLGLTDLFATMAGGDRFLYDVAQKVVLAGVPDPDVIVYRQRVLADCIEHKQVALQLYTLAGEAIEGERSVWRTFSRDPDLTLSMAERSLERLLPILDRLRQIAEEHGPTVASDGFANFFATLRGELDVAYLSEIQEHLRLLRFRDGVSINGRLGKRNAGTDFTLIRPATRSWRRFLGREERHGRTIYVARDDDGSHQALAELKARGINLVANAVSQAVDHMISFFKMVRFEVGFYLAAINLHDRLLAIGEPMCYPEPCRRGSAILMTRALVDAGLSLRTGRPSVGNDLDAEGRSLILISGANQGGKPTFLRAVGVAQVMMQCGLFVAADRFTADVRNSVFTHFKRREDATMASGKLDEELKRFGDIAAVATPNGLFLFNEAFAATNEREGADIAEGIIRALREAGDTVIFVTHSYELARRYLEVDPSVRLLRAERLDDGRRTYRLLENAPLPTGFGQDLFERIFAPMTEGQATATGRRGDRFADDPLLESVEDVPG